MKHTPVGKLAPAPAAPVSTYKLVSVQVIFAARSTIQRFLKVSYLFHSNICFFPKKRGSQRGDSRILSSCAVCLRECRSEDYPQAY